MPAQDIQTLARQLAALDADALQLRARTAGANVAKAGAWPAWIDVESSIVNRIPANGGTASGFDAGLACTLGLMPPHAEKLVATLHAAYTPGAVADVRAGIHKQNDTWHIKDAQSPACWWLAACSLCVDGDDVDLKTLHKQITDFAALAADDGARKTAAEKTLNDMCRNFDTTRGYAFGARDGCMQGAYIAGHDMAVMHAQHHGVYFIGTFHPSLGLENFSWGSETDDKGRAKSGPVHGSRQFVKCADESELAAAVAQAQKHLGITAPAAKATKPAACKP